MLNVRGHKNSKGFTLIELLVVIAIISLLSTVIIASVRVASNKAKIVKTKQKMSEYSKIVSITQQESGTTLFGITGHTFSAVNCTVGSPTYAFRTDFNTMASDDPRRVLLRADIDKAIKATNGAYNISSNLDFYNDAWGYPLMIDANQGEGTFGAGKCQKNDDLRSIGPDGLVGTYDDIAILLPLTENCQ